MKLTSRSYSILKATASLDLSPTGVALTIDNIMASTDDIMTSYKQGLNMNLVELKTSTKAKFDETFNYKHLSNADENKPITL